MTLDDHSRRAAPRRNEHGEEVSEDQCWAEFWEIIGRAAYRVWREDQSTTQSPAPADAGPSQSAA
jgi:hypothetical protein